MSIVKSLVVFPCIFAFTYLVPCGQWELQNRPIELVAAWLKGAWARL